MNLIAAVFNFMIRCVEIAFNKGQKMTKNIFTIVLDTLPNKFPTTPDQDAFILKLSEVSGVTITQDKPTAALILGPKMLTAGGCYATINPETEVIILNENANNDYWYSTIFHELAHATGSSKRFNRVGVVACQTKTDYHLEEIIAESVAMRVMESMGLATDETRAKSNSYIQSYERPLIMFGAMVDVMKLDYEISKAEALVMDWLNKAGLKAVSQGVEFKAA